MMVGTRISQPDIFAPRGQDTITVLFNSMSNQDSTYLHNSQFIGLGGKIPGRSICTSRLKMSQLGYLHPHINLGLYISIKQAFYQVEDSITQSGYLHRRGSRYRSWVNLPPMSKLDIYLVLGGGKMSSPGYLRPRGKDALAWISSRQYHIWILQNRVIGYLWDERGTEETVAEGGGGRISLCQFLVFIY